MTANPTPRYIVVVDRHMFVIVDTQTGQHLARTDSAEEAERLAGLANKRHEAEQARLDALARASGRPR